MKILDVGKGLASLNIAINVLVLLWGFNKVIDRDYYEFYYGDNARGASITFIDSKTN